MTKEKYMALADFQTLWTNSIKPYIVSGFIAMLAGTHANAKNLVLADGTNIAQATFIAATEKGANSGVATLGADGKVPASQLPSFVDDVLEGYLNATDGKFYEENTYTTEIPAEGGKIYVDLATSKTYRWGGSAYAEISASIALGETQGTAYEGSKGKANADAIAALQTDKANKSEMAIEAVSGDSTKKTITLKTGLAQDVLVAHQDISGKANLAVPSAAGNIATLDANGDLTDSGVAATTIGDKANKVSGATNGNFAGLDANGDLTDSGSKAADFATAAQGAKADSAIQTVKVNGTALTPDSNKAVDVEVPERVTSTDLEGFIV